MFLKQYDRKDPFYKKNQIDHFIFIVLTWALVPEVWKEGRATPPQTVACYIKVMIDLSKGLFPCHSWGLSSWKGCWTVVLPAQGGNGVTPKLTTLTETQILKLLKPFPLKQALWNLHSCLFDIHDLQISKQISFKHGFLCFFLISGGKSAND